MSSSTVELLREVRGTQESNHGSPSPPSAQSLQPQESTRNAWFDQSPPSERLGTSPTSPHHHHPTIIHNPLSGPQEQRPTSSPSALPTSTSAHSTVRGSYISNQPGSAGGEARSPANRRAPASRSSHGIATADGPPPALITQRSYHGDPWRNSLPTVQPNLTTDSSQQPKVRASGTTPIKRGNSAIPKGGGESNLDAMKSFNADRGAMNGKSYRHSRNEEEEDDTLRFLDASNGGERGSGPENDPTYSSNEDIFLHLARTESEAGSTLNPGKGTSRRGSQVGSSNPRPARASRPLTGRPASSGDDFGAERTEDQKSPWSRSGRFDTPTNGRQSSPQDRSYAASAHPLESGKRRYLHSELSSKASFTTPRARDGSFYERSPEFTEPYGRRQSITESTPGLPPGSFKQSGRSYFSGNHYNSSPLMNISPHVDPVRRQHSFRLEGTESTISTTAPSTVWDELDDLKSRIRKIELTGKLPSSSGAAISGAVNGRPRTASTTMTTASISPKRRHANVSPNASTVKDTDTSSLHPLLHSALAKAREWIDPKAYKVLETTASDALTLAAMAGNPRSTGEAASQNTSQTIDRQIRRKADSMCRSLTELCIVLSEEKSSTEPAISTSRPGSRAGRNLTTDIQTPENSQTLRSTSQEPERSSSRIMSRLEARRTSLLAANTSTPPNAQNANSESPLIHQEAPTPTQRPTLTDRTSSALLHRRRTVDGNITSGSPTYSINNNINKRSISRSTATTADQRPSPVTRLSSTTTTTPTEQRSSPIMRISREYTSQHPLPAHSSSSSLQQQQQHCSPSIRSSLPSSSSTTTTRRSYFPTNNNSLSTPSNQHLIQPGSRKYMSSQTPPSLAANSSNRFAEARQQRIASLGQYAGGRRLRLVDGEEAS
ncbi:MAG: hypothetical protein Q9184_003612 [Pyrenodesmia sp. 2 TL-2023]